MTLTLGHGPLSTDPAPANYTVDGPAHRIMVEDHPKRFRIEVAGETVVDTTGARLLHESNLLPVVYVPIEDVRTDLLTRTDTVTHCPFKGDATYWTLTVGDRVEPDLFWGYEDPNDGVSAIAGYVAAYLDRVDAVYEEEQRLHGHPRDPYHRVDTLPSSRHVVVRRGDRVLADTSRPMAVFETGLAPRYYVPETDVQVELVDSETSTICPYKGHAVYRSLPDGPADVAWSYPDPFGEGQGLEGHWSFWGDDVVVEVDGEPA